MTLDALFVSSFEDLEFALLRDVNTFVIGFVGLEVFPFLGVCTW